ncbi:MAG: sugar phosphate isomerase/epimerase family protein [Bacilli bacterium]|nr:sugar phosphate isomerase/epimerase family protein [Bacilli bacterium]
MREIRLCTNDAFDETVKNCINNKLGIEVQLFADIIQRKREDTSEDIVNNRVEKELIKEKEVLDKMNCGKSLHAPFAGLEPGSKDYYDQEKINRYLNKAYEVALKLGCTEMVVHNGYNIGTYYVPKYIERSIDYWKEFLKNKDDTITICIENQFELDSEMIKEIIDGVNDKRLKVCLDIGHAHANSIMPVEKWIETLGDRIVYYHLHNNHGKQNIPKHDNDEHLGLNHGTIDIKNVLDFAEKYTPDAIWNLESKTYYQQEDIETLKSLGYINNNIKKK